MIFETVMLVCFGASWPLAIYKTFRAKNPAGKSIPFLYLVVIGYTSGCLHKVFGNFDPVFYLYALNGVMVLIDLLLTYYYLYFYPRKLTKARI